MGEWGSGIGRMEKETGRQNAALLRVLCWLPAVAFYQRSIPMGIVGSPIWTTTLIPVAGLGALMTP